MKDKANRLPNQLLKGFFILALLTCGVFFLSSQAWAQGFNPTPPKTLGEMTDSVFGSLLSLQAFLSLLSYVLGIYFTVTGLMGLRAHVLDPGNNPLYQQLMRLGAAVFFIYAPETVNFLTLSIGGSSFSDPANQLALNYKNKTDPLASPATGLEGGLIRFVLDFATPFLEDALPYFCYIAGLVFMMIGLQRMAKGAFDGPRDPSYMGTFGTFFVAATLMSLGYIMYTLNFSIFGDSDVWSNPLVKTAAGTDAAMETRMNQLMWGVFIFLRIVGYISVVRGLFMLRAAGEGGQVSMMSVTTHLLAGAMLANATGFVMLVQNTFVSDPNDFILKL